jgi:hypothetical protein
VNGSSTEDVALVVVQIHRETVFFRFASLRSVEHVVPVQRIAARISAAQEALCFIALNNTFHFLRLCVSLLFRRYSLANIRHRRYRRSAQLRLIGVPRI